MDKELIWNVFIYDFNANKIREYNVFNNAKFFDGLKSIKKEMKKQKIEDKDWFLNKVYSKAMNAFWSKCEYEVMISGEFKKSCEEKVDVFWQLNLNFNQFVDYIWNNLKLLKVR